MIPRDCLPRLRYRRRATASTATTIWPTCSRFWRSNSWASSLEEIKQLRAVGPQRLPDVLAQQKAMLHEKRAQLANVIQAIEENERLLQSGAWDWGSLVQVIQAMQMDQNNDWVKKYFTPEQQEKMNELSQASYSEEARKARPRAAPGLKRTEESRCAVGCRRVRTQAAHNRQRRPGRCRSPGAGEAVSGPDQRVHGRQ